VSQSTASPALITADELAAALNIPKRSVYALAREDRIPTVRIGRRVRFDVRAVVAALAVGQDGRGR
jgi:excisionase family DNA binding protein